MIHDDDDDDDGLQMKLTELVGEQQLSIYSVLLNGDQRKWSFRNIFLNTPTWMG